MKTWMAAGLALPLLWFVPGRPAVAHGAQMRHRMGVEVEARYDTGAPMAHAQVAVFAPHRPEAPVLTGKTDGTGMFWFVPETVIADQEAPNALASGIWEVQVRLAGHGALLKVPVASEAQGEASGTAASGLAVTPLQRFVMGAAGLWGFVGTALFFSRRSASGAAASTDRSFPASPIQSR